MRSNRQHPAPPAGWSASLLAALVAGFALIVAAPGQASGQSFIDFPIGINVPNSIAAGPDGNVWFANYIGYSVGRMTPQGVFTNFPTPTGLSTDIGIALGPDRNLWFTESLQSKIGRITPQGVITEFPTPGSADPFQHHGPLEICAGPDGNLWFTEAVGNVARITTAGVITEFPVTNSAALLSGISAGPDGNLWFTEVAGNKIGRITTGGVVTEFPLTTAFAQPWGITSGPDGNLWFTESAAATIGRITTAGVITEFALSSDSYPYAITVGPDGNLWFTQFTYPKITRITTSGTSTDFPLPLAAGTLTVGIAAGPDGNLWLSEDNAGGDRIGRFTPPPATSPPPGFYALTPCRVADTRGPAGPYGSPALSAGATRVFLMAGSCGIPSSAKAVALNVTVTQATPGPGFSTFFAGGTTRPTASTINYGAGQTRANNAIIALGTNGEISVFCGQSSGTVELIIDVNGYFD